MRWHRLLITGLAVQLKAQMDLQQQLLKLQMQLVQAQLADRKRIEDQLPGLCQKPHEEIRHLGRKPRRVNGQTCLPVSPICGITWLNISSVLDEGSS